MKIKHITICLALALPVATFAQKKKNEEIDEKKVYQYEMLRNDPEGVRNLRAAIVPVIVDINNSNIWFGGGADAGFRLNNKFELELGYQTAYLHTKDDSYNTSVHHGFSVYETTKTNSFTGIAKVFFGQQVQDTEESVHLKSVGNTDYRARIPAKRLQMYSGRIGYTTGYEFVANGDIVYKGYDINDAAQTEMEFGGEFFTDMMKYSTISVGISRVRISYLKVKFADFKGDRKIESSTEVYADVLFSTKMELDNMLVPQQWDGSAGNWLDYRVINVNDNTPKSKIGARIGIQENGLSGFGWYYGAELGLRPGIKPADGMNGYLMVKVGALISAFVD